jgi:hypothetical protein
MTAPLIPNVDRLTYEAERFTVHTSLGRRVALNGQDFRLYAQDWPTLELCEQAASAAAIIFNKGEAFRYVPIDNMADHIARDLGQDLSRPYGFALILEPV